MLLKSFLRLTCFLQVFFPAQLLIKTYFYVFESFNLPNKIFVCCHDKINCVGVGTAKERTAGIRKTFNIAASDREEARQTIIVSKKEDFLNDIFAVFTNTDAVWIVSYQC